MSRGHPPARQRTTPPGHGLGPGEYTNALPGRRGHENRYYPSGGRGRERNEGFELVPPASFPSKSPIIVSTNIQTVQLSNAPRHAFAVDYSYDNKYTGYSRGGGQQRGTDHHHRLRSRGLPSSSSSSNNSEGARLVPRQLLLLQLFLLRLPAQLKSEELPCSSPSHVW